MSSSNVEAWLDSAKFLVQLLWVESLRGRVTGLSPFRAFCFVQSWEV